MQDHRRKLSNFLSSHCHQAGRACFFLPSPGCSRTSTLLPKDPPHSDKMDQFLCNFSQGATPTEYDYFFFLFFKQNLFSHGLVPYKCQMTPDARPGPHAGAHGWEERRGERALSAPDRFPCLNTLPIFWLTKITIFQRISEHLQLGNCF